MRYVVTTLILLSVVMVGCKNQNKNPQMTSEPPAPTAEAMPPAQPMPPLPPAEPVPAAPSKPLESLASPGSSGTYVIESGDTFYSISRKLFGNNSRAKDIQALNPGVDPRKLRPGQTINVPEK